MIKVAVAGAAGRMGRRICALVSEFDGLTLTGAYEAPGNPAIGKGVSEFSGADAGGLKVTEGIASVLGSSDVIVSFTWPEPTVSDMKAASDAGRAMVIGTTGLGEAQRAEIAKHAAKVPCVMASNMSLGVNLLMKVLADIARALGDPYDVEVIEAHHKLKKDAPSGTAIMMAEAVAGALGRDLKEHGVYARHGMIGERKPREIGIQTIRAGDIVGEHTVMFCGIGERIEVTHKISSRDTFARGALRAAGWLSGRKPGLYDMQDVLGLRG